MVFPPIIIIVEKCGQPFSVPHLTESQFEADVRQISPALEPSIFRNTWTRASYRGADLRDRIWIWPDHRRSLAAPRLSKGLGPPACAMEDAKNMNRVAKQTVRHDERCPRDYQFACSRDPARPPHLRTVGKQCLDIVQNMQHDALRRCGIVLFNIGTERDEVSNSLWRPDWRHERFGTGFSSALPQEATQSLTELCGIPSP